VQAFTQEYNDQLAQAGDGGARSGWPPAAVVFTGPAARQPADRGAAVVHQPGRGARRADVRDDDARLKAVYGLASEYGVLVILAGTGER
jgi:hypothetical protein